MKRNHVTFVLFVLCALVLCVRDLKAGDATLSASGSFQETLGKVDRLLEKRQWDRSENLLLGILKSPRVEERLFACEKLLLVYKKLGRKKKALKIEEQLREEKAFRERVVPAAEEIYQLYEVQKGDSYGKLAAKYAVSEEWLIRVNQNRLLHPGEAIKIPKQQDSIFIDTEAKKLFWMRGETLVKAYPVAVGKVDTKTPQGEFAIAEKVQNPTWYTPGKIIPPDSPKNLLGTRWLGLNQKGYGIHGTRNPYSIGKAASHGCIRLLNQDVEELFLWIPLGTKVVIQGKKDEPPADSPVV